MEVWKIVDNYPDYEVSNNNGWKRKGKSYKGVISKGYRYVSLGKKEGKQLYHILVAKAFPEICGEWFEGCQVHHKNFDKLDNRPENLIVLTPSEHSKIHYQEQSDEFKKPSPKRNLSISKALKGRNAVEKHIPIYQFTKDNKYVKRWECISEVKEFGFDPSNICSCCKGKIKSAYGFVWQYADNM